MRLCERCCGHRFPRALLCASGVTDAQWVTVTIVQRPCPPGLPWRNPVRGMADVDVSRLLAGLQRGAVPGLRGTIAPPDILGFFKGSGCFVKTESQGICCRQAAEEVKYWASRSVYVQNTEELATLQEALDAEPGASITTGGETVKIAGNEATDPSRPARFNCYWLAPAELRNLA
eukprot:Skav220241  [mRNA]  locus=scaffold3452:60527:66479:- [translate_table: standard]